MSRRNEEINLSLRQAITALCQKHGPFKSLLDVGCWDGSGTLLYARAARAQRIAGIELFANQAEVARRQGIDVRVLDIEENPMPFASGEFDVVICNQVLEHLKQIYLPMDEICRVLKWGGTFVVSVPNLASFHNRIFLLFGYQPTCIRVFGPHPRGYTAKAFREFLCHGEFLEVKEMTGVGFYPFSSLGVGRWLARLWKDAVHTPIFVLTKVKEFDPRNGWNARINRQGEQSGY